MVKALLDALEDCLERLQAGQSLEECLQGYPEQAGELRPLLETALRASAVRVDEPPSDVVQRTRTRFLAQAAALRPATRTTHRYFPRLSFALAAGVLVLVTSGGAIAVASAQSLPGDPLYGVKRAAEHIRLNLTAAENRSTVVDAFRQRRTDETRALLAEGRSEKASIYGILAGRDGNRMMIDGVVVEIGEFLEDDRDIELGDLLEVEGRTTRDGVFLADVLHRLAFEVEGRLQIAGDGSWVIDGFQIMPEDLAVRDGYTSGESVRAHIELDEEGSPHLEALERVSDGEGDRQPGVSDDGSDDDNTGRGESPSERHELSTHGTLQARSQAYLRVSGSYYLIDAGSEIEEGLQIGDWIHIEVVRVGSGPYIITKAELADKNDQSDGTAESSDDSESEPDHHEGESEPDHPDDDDPPDGDD